MSKILLVEDDEVLAKMYKKKFELDGFEVLVAYSGHDALVVVPQLKPDVVLLDVMMPGMDGFQVLKTLKSDPKVSQIPVVILTNLGSSQMFIDEAKRLGAAEYLIKYKTSAETVLETVKKQINK